MPDRERIAALYGEAAELGARERAAFLDQACAGDGELRAEIESLLAAHDRAGDFLERPPTDLLDETGGAADGVGKRVGAYRLLSELGRGGMGIVYLAERADGAFEQQVALKLIHRAFVSEALLERFVRERRVLARLEHPHIARLLDGGVAEDGRPYFAMEVVRGSPLLAYCDHHQLALGSRLELFGQACRAVQHAHANLVVHRDLKPSNMLVGGDGALKLLDFGIAKLLDDDAEAGTGLTRAGIQPLTPEYAAPEQREGRPATTATDVYSLGVVLCELLTGHRPCFPPAGGEPVALKDVAGRRLDRDLAAVIDQALERDPGERYPSVEALGEDLRRFRAGLPVRARPASLAYRTRKLFFRHRLTFTAATAAAVALVAGLAVSLWQARIAASERDTAERAMRRAEQVQTFLTGLFEGVDPAATKGEAITARELLERGAARVEAELVGQPEAQAELLHTLARVNLSLGRYDQARKLAERELELARGLHGPRHPDVARALNVLGNAHAYLGDFDAGAECYREALALRRELLGNRHRDVAQSLNDLAIALQESAEPAQAAAMYREALAIYAALGEESEEAATTSSNLGGLLRQQGDLAGAEVAQREALRLWRLRLDEDHPLIAAAQGDLAQVRFDQGQLAEAESLNRQSLAVQRRVLGPDHPSVSTRLNNLALVLLAQGDPAGAESLLREVLAIDRKNLGAEHPFIAISLDNLATALARQGRDEEALSLFREALAMHKKLRGADHPRVAVSLRRQAEALMGMKRWRPALAALDQALAISKARPAAHPPDLAEISKLREEVLAKLAALPP